MQILGKITISYSYINLVKSEKIITNNDEKSIKS